MQTKAILSTADLKRMAAAAEAEADSNGWKVSFAICDDGGHMLWMQRLDGAPPMSAHVAPAKATSAALGRRETKVFEEMINNGRTAFITVPTLDGLLEGGVPVMVDGQCVGAVGVSGVRSDQDAQIAKAAIAALEAK